MARASGVSGRSRIQSALKRVFTTEPTAGDRLLGFTFFLADGAANDGHGVGALIVLQDLARPALR